MNSIFFFEKYLKQCYQNNFIKIFCWLCWFECNILLFYSIFVVLFCCNRICLHTFNCLFLADNNKRFVLMKFVLFNFFVNNTQHSVFFCFCFYQESDRIYQFSSEIEFGFHHRLSVVDLLPMIEDQFVSSKMSHQNVSPIRILSLLLFLLIIVCAVVHQG